MEAGSVVDRGIQWSLSRVLSLPRFRLQTIDLNGQQNMVSFVTLLDCLAGAKRCWALDMPLSWMSPCSQKTKI